MKLIDVRGVSLKTNDAISSVWKKAGDAASDYPKPVKIGGKTLWLESEVDEYIQRKIEDFRTAPTGKRETAIKAAKASATSRRSRIGEANHAAT